MIYFLIGHVLQRVFFETYLCFELVRNLKLPITIINNSSSDSGDGDDNVVANEARGQLTEKQLTTQISTFSVTSRDR